MIEVDVGPGLIQVSVDDGQTVREVIVGTGGIVADVTNEPIVANLANQGPQGPAGGGGEELSSPVFTYDAGLLVGIEYADGTTVTLTYDAGRLTQSVQVSGSVTTTKTFVYSDSGDVLIRIDEVVT